MNLGISVVIFLLGIAFLAVHGIKTAKKSIGRLFRGFDYHSNIATRHFHYCNNQSIITMNLAIAVDTETTGLLVPDCFPMEMQPRIIEISAILFDIDNGEYVDEISEYVNPFVSIPRKITGITGITNADVRDAPIWENLVSLLAVLGQQSRFIFAHNAVFDKRVIEYNCKMFEANNPFEQNDWGCTMIESQWIQSKPIKMLDLYEYLFSTPLNQTHRAREDVEALIKICVELHKMQSLFPLGI